MFRQLHPKALHPLLRGPYPTLSRGLVRNPVGSPLNAIQKHHFHKPVPFSGPPTYETIMRRFSSHPNPLVYFSEKKEKEAIERGDFVDIHDIGSPGSDPFDVLITDVTDDILRTEIAEVVGVPYLGKASLEEADKLMDMGQGFLFGDNSRPIFPCVVRLPEQERAYWVFFFN